MNNYQKPTTTNTVDTSSALNIVQLVIHSTIIFTKFVIIMNQNGPLKFGNNSIIKADGGRYSAMFCYCVILLMLWEYVKCY